ncbi:hypothetical protein P389DRAFT_15250 [Cystobasidium minutum MCA 4210]|uniref:uncharacterized protein n=1 Tax=Cystobasidium minutum MCA 4210 TaxID=1397322 RepID=UPI0034CE141B|eukprot:jgi/Rhomi1/15250/CE15249_106
MSASSSSSNLALTPAVTLALHICHKWIQSAYGVRTLSTQVCVVSDIPVLKICQTTALQNPLSQCVIGLLHHRPGKAGALGCPGFRDPRNHLLHLVKEFVLPSVTAE